MTITWKIPRNCLAWLLLAHTFLIVPHIERLPIWVLVTYIVCAIWRIMVFQGRWSFPHPFVKILLAFACSVSIYQNYGSFFGLEPTVALLFAGFSLKLLEVVNKRDVYVVIFLGFFVALTEFLFSQDFLVTCLVFLSILLISTSLVALHQERYDQFNMVSLRKAGVLFLQAIPLMVVLYIVFPRFDPLWEVPLPSHQTKTGISDTLSPGDISNLSQSTDLAFRAYFEGKTPAIEKMYWRALVMSEFDGRSWSQGDWQKKPVDNTYKSELEQQIVTPIKYRIIQEPTHQPWLFSLALANSDDTDIDVTKDLRLLRKKDIHSRISYEVTSDITAVLEPTLDIKYRYLDTLLPSHGDPKARSFARHLYNNMPSEKAYVHAVMRYFRDKPFVYTLRPPQLGDNSIDEFLFSTRKGFCSHYASSFVFLMRSVGIAARVVTGYQGGEINPITGTVLVHQFDAHAWAEIWIENEGWTRVDPTAIVSPTRIERGLQAALYRENSFLSRSLLSPLHYRDVPWVNQVRLSIDALSYYWHNAVLQYKGKQQLQVLQKLLGEVSPWRVASLFLGVGLLVMSIVSFSLFRRRGQEKTETYVRIYLRLCKRLERAGFERKIDEGPINYARRMAEQDKPWGQHLYAATRAFVTLSYEPVAKVQKKALLKQLRRESLKITYLLHMK